MPFDHIKVWELTVAGGVLLLFSVFTGILYLLLHRVARRLSRRFRNRMGDRLITAVTGPLLILVFVQGLLIAANILTLLDPWREEIRTGFSVVFIILIVLMASRSAGILFDGYMQLLARRRTSGMARQLGPPGRRVVLLGIYFVGILLILDQLGISITPLVATLGIGGLAVALALQPVLGNFFAGTYILTDGAIGVGDYIELESGISGYVHQMGWRSTKILTVFNNLIIIPNSRLADSIVTNYQSPTAHMWVMVTGGVSYESDLAKVEQIALEVASSVVEGCSGAVKRSEPWFGFDGFGDSNIDFWFFIEATDRLGGFQVKHELLKALHERFNLEGIVINYPVRKLILPESKTWTSSGV